MDIYVLHVLCREGVGTELSGLQLAVVYLRCLLCRGSPTTTRSTHIYYLLHGEHAFFCVASWVRRAS